MFAVKFLLVLFLLIFASRHLIKFQSEGNTLSDKQSRFKLMAFSTMFCASIWTIYGVIFYPGLISWDFYVQWHEMSGNIQFSEWHSVFHTLVIWMLTRLWYSPAMISLAQILTMSLLVGMAAIRLDQFRLPAWLILLTVTFYALFPLNGFYAVSLWKDIGYSIVFFWVTILLIEVVLTKGNNLSKRSKQTAFIISLCCLSLMRHNGIIPAFGTLLLLFLVYYRTQLKALMLISVFLVAFIMIFIGPVYRLLNVDVGDKNIIKAHLPIQHIGAILKAGGKLNEKEEAFLSQILPLPYWKKAYRAHSCMPLIHGKDNKGNRYLKSEFLKQDNNFKTLKKIWLNLVFRNPSAIFQYYGRSTELLWRIHAPYNIFVIADEDLIEEHLYSGYYPAEKLSERVGKVGRFLIYLIQNRTMGWFFHRGALYFWLSLFFITLTIIRTKRPTILVVSTPMLLQALTVAIFPLIQNTRFMFPIILVAPLIITLFFGSNVLINSNEGSGSLSKDLSFDIPS